MLKISAGAMAAATMLMLSGCGEKTASTPTINASMTGVMEPTAQAIWDIVSNAYNANGDALMGTRITDADWSKVREASQKLKDRAALLANAEHIIVAASNEPVLGSQAVGMKGAIGPAWDALGAKQVQARIDAQPALFAQKAHALADAADAINRASLTKDPVLLYQATSGLDEVCDGCHEPFWGTDEPPPFPHSSAAQSHAN